MSHRNPKNEMEKKKRCLNSSLDYSLTQSLNTIADDINATQHISRKKQGN
jgi:hypothetical protein